MSNFQSLRYELFSEFEIWTIFRVWDTNVWTIFRVWDMNYFQSLRYELISEFEIWTNFRVWDMNYFQSLRYELFLLLWVCLWKLITQQYLNLSNISVHIIILTCHVLKVRIEFHMKLISSVYIRVYRQ